MQKFKFLTKYAFLKRIRSKAFFISNIVILVLLIVLLNLASIITFFSGEDEMKHYQVGYVVLVDDSEGFDYQQKLEEHYEILAPNQLSFVKIDDQNLAQSNYEEGLYQALLIIKGQNLNGLNIDYYGSDYELKILLQNGLSQLIISYKNEGFIPPNYVDYDQDDTDDMTESTGISMAVSMILLVPMFILTIMATQFLGVDIVEEKSSKAIETIISSVPAKYHFLAKITSNFLFIIFQSFLFIVFTFVGTMINQILFGSNSATGSMDGQITLAVVFEQIYLVIPNFWVLLVIGLVGILVGTLLYLVIAAMFASMTTSQEDYQQFQGPLMITLMLGFYVSIYAPMFGEGAKTVMIVLSFIPIFTPLALPYALFSGYVNVYVGLLAIFILIVFIYLLIKIVEPVYKVSILNYDQSKFFKRVRKNLKSAFSKK